MFNFIQSRQFLLAFGVSSFRITSSGFLSFFPYPLHLIDALLLKGFCSLNNSLTFSCLSLLEFSGLHYCLFVKVLLFLSCFRSAACLYYHSRSRLSTTFLSFFRCQQVFAFACLSLAATVDILAQFFLHVNTFFAFLFFRLSHISSNLTYFLKAKKKNLTVAKILFIMASLPYASFIFSINERRRRDLNPRAGHPTYTLSRGASSAS